MITPTILDLTTGRLPAIIVTGRESVGSSEKVYGLCSPDVTDAEIRGACGKTEITMSGYPSVSRSTTGLGVHVQRFTVSAYLGGLTMADTCQTSGRRSRVTRVANDRRPAAHHLPEVQGGEVTPREQLIIVARIVAAASCVCAVAPRAVYSQSRMQNPLRARMVSCWLACEVLGVRETAIARMIGRDHTTVINARKRVAAQVHAKAGPLFEIAAATVELLQIHATQQEHRAA